MSHCQRNSPQVSTIWTILLRDFDLEMTTPLPKPAYNDMVVGPDAPIHVRYKRKVPLAQAEAAKAKARADAAAAVAFTEGAAAAKTEAAAAAESNSVAAVAAQQRAAGGGVSLSKPVGGAFPRGPLLILWGSQTGTAEGFGNMLAREARQRGFDARSVDLEAYAPEKLADEDEAPVVFLMATHGEGEPTDNAAAFYKFLEDERCDNLKSVRFAAFALGNKQYEHFGAMGNWVDRKLAALGATRLYPLAIGDDDDDLEGDFETWRDGLWAALSPELRAAAGGIGNSGSGTPFVLSTPAAQFECEWLDGASEQPPPLSTLQFLARSLPKHQLFECDVAVNRELTQKPEHGSVRHVELRTDTAATAASGGVQLRYNTADDLAVCCDNGAVLTARVATRLGLLPTARFVLRLNADAASGARAPPPPPLPTPCSVEQALRFFADLRAPVSKELLLLLADACAAPAEAERLRALTAPENKQRYNEYVLRDGRGLSELLEEYGSCCPPLGALLEFVPKLSPRFYTISSSPASTPSRVHLSVKVLREQMRGAADERVKEGVCSTQLGALVARESTACVFVRPSGFRLPADPAAPVVMIGPGTGIAPFRAFLCELDAARNAAVAASNSSVAAASMDGEDARSMPRSRTGHVRLYFGCRRPDEDYLYKEELDAALSTGTLSSLRVAFSRARPDGTKVYVQHLVSEDGADLWEMLAAGGHVYICGGTAMGRDVVAALHDAIALHGAMPREAAAAYVKEMQARGRLMQELWS